MRNGDGRGGVGGTSAHTAASCSLGLSTSINKLQSDPSPEAKSKTGIKAAQGTLKFRYGMTVPPLCLALLLQSWQEVSNGTWFNNLLQRC
jgi:hypothetical protein